MKQKFGATKTTLAAFSLILLAIIILPPVLSVQEVHSATDILLVNALFYLGFSPVIYVLIKLIRYNRYTRITVTGEALTGRSGAGYYSIPWEDLDRLFFDCIEIPAYRTTRYYCIYETGDALNAVRFNRLMNEEEIAAMEDMAKTGTLKKKFYDPGTYGLYLDRKQCDTLIRCITDYSGQQPVRKKGLI